MHVSVCLSVTGSDVELSMLRACVCLSVCLSVTGSDVELSMLHACVCLSVCLLQGLTWS